MNIVWDGDPEHPILTARQPYAIVAFAVNLRYLGAPYLDLVLASDSCMTTPLRFWWPEDICFDFSELPGPVTIHDLSARKLDGITVLVHQAVGASGVCHFAARSVEVLHDEHWVPRTRNNFPLADPDEERWVQTEFPIGRMSPEEYAAREAHSILCFSASEQRYRDSDVEAWMARLGDILFKRNGAPSLDELRASHLTNDERARIASEIEQMNASFDEPARLGDQD